MIHNLKNVIRDFVFGMEDGLVSNLGLVLGVHIGGGSTYVVILAGIASMVAGAFSMSAGSYLSAKSQREVYEHEIAVTKRDLKKDPQQALREMCSILKREGFDRDEIKAMIRHFEKHNRPTLIINYIQKKLGLSEERFELPLRNAFTMFISFLIGSFFPIIPFLLFSGDNSAIVAMIMTIGMLFMVGWAKAKYTHLNWVNSGLEIALIGIGAAILGYVAGLLIRIIF